MADDPSSAATKSDDAAIGRWVRILLIAAATGGGGFSISQGVDLFNAKAWQDANVQRLMEAERTQDRLTQCKAKVDAYEQQNQILIELVSRLQERRDGHPGGRHGDLPDLPTIE